MDISPLNPLSGARAADTEWENTTSNVALRRGLLIVILYPSEKGTLITYTYI
ncbi:hypothetical protein JCM19239_6664 [Vibrio variabilis]|uniref:Uncharacterized protein n=1 Tax=Vibrio variabilis TaxID=990271 RepID=A0ABQ0JF20_9VIBR|nr:hypothetical protein JCM19239_6664 [Vibrio variabilis]